VNVTHLKKIVILKEKPHCSYYFCIQAIEWRVRCFILSWIL
jgi:hypothetical protein